MHDWFVVILFLAFCFFVLASIILWSLHNGISPMPTSRKVKRCMLSAFPEKVTGKIYDLGSGWGTLLFPLAKRYPESQIVGYETSPIPYWFSKMRCKLGGYPNVQIVKKDFFEASLAEAGLIVCYLYPGAMARLKRKFETELPHNSWVVSSTFSIPGWPASKVLEVKDLYYTKVYVYRK